MVDGSPALSVIIVSFNTRDSTVECVRSVIDDAGVADVEIVVVDNGSTDGSVEALRTAFPQIVVDDTGENLGFARAVNRGVHQATGELVVLLNPDTVALPGSLRALVDFEAAHPEYGVYGGRTLTPAGALDPSSCWGEPTLWSMFCFATMLSTVFHGSKTFDPESLGRWQRDSVREVPIVTGCLLLIRRDSYESLGGLDERFFLYGEDAEFSIRARRQGLRPVIVPEAEIVHENGGSTSGSHRKMAMIMAGKTTMFRLIWPRGRARVAIGLLLVGVFVRAALETATRRPRRTWSVAWATRADWLPGYPHAESAIFGRPSIREEIAP
ncbi:glycosyltransferase family 2 protein [Amnibacterium flavum]|uniref:glycosyltransferase family 2 protein n=1 Tax=Amnibacterium flavum TaxID=2173173 RepID=UPI001403A74D|nr:glycosyltransferase family 2 protein [Amnibacterium flavum]